ncbi:MAG: gfo/Idh/MocA family oxidoreductase [Phycisphaera sp.]|nr:gfo/Idh/MocA family oxidoreductase [Phycisphaera sp.]
MSGEVLRWGILGTGNIAGQFAQGIRKAGRAQLVAVASRLEGSARAFADKHKVPHALAPYEALLGLTEVQAVYISLPNTLHHEWAIRCLNAGKHVLCEKPLACSAQQTREMFDAAQRNNRLLVEAFMYRSHPQTKAILQHIRNGEVGRVKLIRASFCFCTKNPGTNIRFKPDLCGGGIMDVGCYCVDFSRLMSGGEVNPNTGVQLTAHLHESGVDDLATGNFTMTNGVVSSFACGMLVHTNNTAIVCGDEGYIEVPVPWKPQIGAVYHVGRMTPPKMDAGKATWQGGVETFTVEADRPLYAYEADDFAAAVLDGARPAVTREDSLANAHVLDEMRRLAGLKY